MITRGLPALLADTHTPYITTHSFHGNVTGPMVNTLHTMFMVQYTGLGNAVNPIAQRICSLGQPAPGSYRTLAKQSTLLDAPATPPKAFEKARIPVEGNEAVARAARGVFPLADEAHDEPTADLRTQRLTVHGQTAWMVPALLEE